MKLCFVCARKLWPWQRRTRREIFPFATTGQLHVACIPAYDQAVATIMAEPLEFETEVLP